MLSVRGSNISHLHHGGRLEDPVLAGQHNLHLLQKQIKASTNSLGSVQHLNQKQVTSTMMSVGSSKQSNSKMSDHHSDSLADDSSSMKKPPIVSALQHFFGSQAPQLTVKQRLANFHAKL